MQKPETTCSSGAVVVTGAGSGIGSVIARRFAMAGEPVVIFDHDADAASATVATLEREGCCVTSHVGSVDDESDVARCFTGAANQFGGIRKLVNNAGVSCNSSTMELSLAEWNHAVNVNLTGVFLCAREAARHMEQGGAIVNVSSIYGVVAAPNRLGYCATKSGVAMISKSLALEWANDGIRVNAIAPGYIHTALLESLVEEDKVDVPALQQRTPMGRLGTPDEVADLAYFLTSDNATYVTGQVVGVDGGWAANGYL